MKKQADLSRIENELRGSAFFQSPTPAEPPINEVTTTPTEPTPVATEANLAIPASTEPVTPAKDEAVRPVRSVRPVQAETFGRRSMTRHPFEIYVDQVEALRQLAAEERLNGGVGSMSAMIRHAIDRLIDERRSS